MTDRVGADGRRSSACRKRPVSPANGVSVGQQDRGAQHDEHGGATEREV